MTCATAPLCRSSHVRRTAAAQLVTVEHGDRASVDADVAELRKAAQRAVHVFTGGAHHCCERALIDGDIDVRTVRCGPTPRVGELQQLRRDAAGYIKESDLAHGGVLPLDVDAQARDDPQKKLWPRSKKFKQRALSDHNTFSRLQRLSVRRPLALFIEERQFAQDLTRSGDSENDLAACFTNVSDLHFAANNHVQVRPGVAPAEEVRAALEVPDPDCGSKRLQIAWGEAFEDLRLCQQRQGIRHGAIMAARNRLQEAIFSSPNRRGWRTQ